jgi:uncharacterized protein YdaU (DUF1376 family)
MSITELPWFKVYAAETLSDENFAAFDATERGIWFTLICHCWKEGSIPNDQAKLARLCNCTAEAMQLHWDCIAKRFARIEGSDRLMSPRLEFERAESLSKCSQKSHVARTNANIRWNKYKTDMQSHCNGNANPMQNDAPQTQIEKNNSTPPTPPQAGESPKRKRRSRAEREKDKEEEFKVYPQEVVDLTASIVGATPDKDKGGRTIRVDDYTLIFRLNEILSTKKAVDPPLLLQAWVDYVASKPESLKAPQYFFGRQEDNGAGANWYPYAVAIWHNRKKEQANV